LILVYLHLPDYREERPPPLDVVGLILFGSGVALLSYVLEILLVAMVSAIKANGAGGCSSSTFGQPLCRRSTTAYRRVIVAEGPAL